MKPCEQYRRNAAYRTDLYSVVDFFQFDADKGFYCYYNHSTALKCLGESKGRKHPTMDPETKRKLHEYFAPRNRAFFSKIGKKFSWEIKQND